MNVLLLSASLPYPTTSGGALRVYSLIRALNKLGHAVHLLCYSDGRFAGRIRRWQTCARQ